MSNASTPGNRQFERGPAMENTGHSTFYCLLDKRMGHETHQLLRTVVVSFKTKGNVRTAPPGGQRGPHAFGCGSWGNTLAVRDVPPKPGFSRADSCGAQRGRRQRARPGVQPVRGLNPFLPQSSEARCPNWDPSRRLVTQRTPRYKSRGPNKCS